MTYNPPMMERRFEVPNGAAMQDLGEALGSELAEGSVVLLRGPLGAGKTTLAQGLARGLGVEEAVSSPSFTLIREYPCRLPAGRLIHMDFYRLSGGPEVWSLGVTDYLGGDDIVVVEWPERADAELTSALEDTVLVVDLSYAEPTAPASGEQGRIVVVTGADTRSGDMLRSVTAPSTVVER